MHRIAETKQHGRAAHAVSGWLRLTLGALVVALALPAGVAWAGGHQGHHRDDDRRDDGHGRDEHHRRHGDSLADWLLVYNTNAIEGTPGAIIDGVKMMEIPQGVLASGSGTSADPALYVGSIDVELPANTSFVLPVAYWYGERYDPLLTGGQHDDPVLPARVFTCSTAKVTIDGETVLDSARGLDDNYVPPTFYDPPLAYSAPTPYGSIAAVYVQGLALVHKPLRRGVHVMHLESEIVVNIPDYYGPGVTLDLGVHYQNSWTITVP